MLSDVVIGVTIPARLTSFCPSIIFMSFLPTILPVSSCVLVIMSTLSTSDMSSPFSPIITFPSLAVNDTISPSCMFIFPVTRPALFTFMKPPPFTYIPFSFAMKRFMGLFDSADMYPSISLLFDPVTLNTTVPASCPGLKFGLGFTIPER